MALDLALGSTVFAYHADTSWERRQNDGKAIEELTVVSETKLSWVIRRGESYNTEFKLPKKLVREVTWNRRLEQQFVDIHVNNMRCRFYLNRDAVDAVAWVQQNRYTITKAVDRCDDANALRAIGRILELTLPSDSDTKAG